MSKRFIWRSSSEKTMYGYATYQETKKRTLDQDDIDGVIYIYYRIYVPYDYNAISTALNNALSGQTVIVSSGSYTIIIILVFQMV